MVIFGVVSLALWNLASTIWDWEGGPNHFHLFTVEDP